MDRLELGTLEVGDRVGEELRRRASASGRSLQQVAAEALEQATAASRRRAWIGEIDRIRAMAPAGVVQPDSTEILRQIRDE